jgi:hypothetical protein
MVEEIVEISCFMQTIETLVKQSEDKNWTLLKQECEITPSLQSWVKC